jgi:hypothetical protein
LSTIEIELVGPTGAAQPGSAPAIAAPIAVDAAPIKPPTMSDAIRERIAALQSGAPPKPAEPAPAEQKAAEAAAPAEPEMAEDIPADAGDAPEVAEPEAKPEPVAAAPEWEAERTELQGVTQRQRDIIAKLESDLAEAKKGNEASASTRAKRIEEAEEMYVREPTKAIRAFVASALGLDPDSDDFKNEMLDVFVDLTTEISGATPDPAHQAKRVSALTRREWDLKDKRRAAGDKTQAGKVAPSEQSDPNRTAVTIVQEHFKPIATKYPHLTALAPELDRKTVEQVLWEVIDKGIARGDFDKNWHDDVLIAKAAELAETHYKGRHTKIQAAIPSTATPGVKPATKQPDQPAAVPSKTSQRQGNGRSLSNADASVAPAQTPPPQVKEGPPVFKTDAERQRWATRHLRGEK